MGDLTKAQYVMRRQALEEELQRTKPPTDPDLDRAQALIEDFARFWEAEPNPAERRKLLASLFAQVWQKDGTIVAVKPRGPFARYFAAATEAATAKTPESHPGKRGDKGEVFTFGESSVLAGVFGVVRGADHTLCAFWSHSPVSCGAARLLGGRCRSSPVLRAARGCGGRFRSRGGSARSVGR
jgi:hypothetical protein